MGAGEMPRTENGAPGSASRMAPTVQVVEAQSEQNDRRADEHGRREVDPDARVALVAAQLEAEEEHHDGQAERDEEDRPPPHERAQRATDEECADARERARRPEGADRGGLLRAAVILGDECHEGGHDDRGGRAGEHLTADRPLDRGRHDHHHRRESEDTQHGAEDQHPAHSLSELRTGHHECRDREAVDDDRRTGDGRRHTEVVDHAAERDRQRGDVERHEHLRQEQADHRRPRAAFLIDRCRAGCGRASR